MAALMTSYLSVVSGMYNIPPTSREEIFKEGLLQRKNELDEGGRKVTC